MASLNNQSSSSSSNLVSELPPPTKENIGRWSEKEHQLFLNGLKKYGKDWKAIASEIPTRSVIQVRTHAQKFFQRANAASRVQPTPPRIRRNDSAASYHPDEQEKVDSESSSAVSPEVSDATISSNANSPTNEPTPQQNENEPTPQKVAPRSNQNNEYIIRYDINDISYSRNPNYVSLSPFETECNDNQDDMDNLNTDNLPTPFESL